MSAAISKQCGGLFVIFALLPSFLLCPLFAETVQSPDPAAVGDAPAQVPPLARDLSPRLKRSDIEKALRKVADWQLNRARPDFNKDWTFAALYAGFMAVPTSVAGSRYQDAMLEMSKSFDWQLGPRIGHADDQAIGQTYMQLYLEHHDPAMMAPTRQSIETVMRMPDESGKAALVVV